MPACIQDQISFLVNTIHIYVVKNKENTVLCACYQFNTEKCLADTHRLQKIYILVGLFISKPFSKCIHKLICICIIIGKNIT